MGLVTQTARQVRIVNVFALLYVIITRADTDVHVDAHVGFKILAHGHILAKAL